MKILGIDTSSPTTCVSVVEDGRVLAEVALTGSVSHSEKVVEICEDIFEKLTMNLEDMDLIAVGIGPGSFTGLRIGVTIAKVFAQALGVEVVGVSSLQAFAMGERGVVASVIDARRGSVYCSLVRYDEDWEVLLEDQVMRLEDFLIEVQKYGEVLLTGPDGLKFAGKFPHQVKLSRHCQMRASNICKLAILKYKNEGADDFRQLVPNYLKVSQAQRQYEEKHKKS